MTKSNTGYIFIALRNVFSSQIVIGIAASVFLLLFHKVTFLLQRRPKPTDLTIAHLALIHMLMLLIRTFLDADILGVEDFWNDITCKAVIYLYRLMRSLSVSTTCMLSVLQAITLSPRSSCLAKFKSRSPQDSLRWLLFLWLFYVPFSTHFSISAVANSTVSSQGLVFVSDSCTILPMTYFLRHLFYILGVFQDVFLIGFMVLSSGYMVTLLCRHRRQCQHLQSNSLSPQASREQWATKTILLLMSFFVLLYSLDCIIFSSRIMWNNNPICHSIQMMVSNGYTTISPLVFISTCQSHAPGTQRPMTCVFCLQQLHGLTILHSLTTLHK